MPRPPGGIRGPSAGRAASRAIGRGMPSGFPAEDKTIATHFPPSALIVHSWRTMHGVHDLMDVGTGLDRPRGFDESGRDWHAFLVFDLVCQIGSGWGPRAIRHRFRALLLAPWRPMVWPPQRPRWIAQRRHRRERDPQDV
jgi:hypothetical protein